MKPGDLVQVIKGVHGQGEIGVVLGEVEESRNWDLSCPLLEVLFHDGPRDCHPSNLQKPDGRTRRRE
jgi:hypothetical protein